MSKVSIEQLTDVLVQRIAHFSGQKPVVRLTLERRHADQGPLVPYTELRYEPSSDLTAVEIRKVFRGLDAIRPLGSVRRDPFRTHEGIYRFVPRTAKVVSKSDKPRTVPGSINIRVWRSSVDRTINFAVSYP